MKNIITIFALWDEDTFDFIIFLVVDESNEPLVDNVDDTENRIEGAEQKNTITSGGNNNQNRYFLYIVVFNLIIFN